MLIGIRITFFAIFSCFIFSVAGTYAEDFSVSPPAPYRTGGSLANLESEVEAVYEMVEPAVVNITATSVGYNIFRQPVPQQGTGSGFLYDSTGHIVTNYHVIENAESITVNFGNGKVRKGTVIGSDPSNDLAVIKVDASGLPRPVTIADSGTLKVGQFVIALGNPFGLDGTLTFGVISALGRTIQSPDDKYIAESIQTDAAINPGNSGGPLINLAGEVIGVNSQIVSPSGSSSGVGFAISSNTVKRVVPELIAHGKFPHPWLGISGIDISPEWKDIFAQAGYPMPVTNGILVMDVDKNSPAGKLGLLGGKDMYRFGNYQFALGGDIIIALNNVPVLSVKDLNIYLEAKSKIGEQVEITYYRGNKKLTGKALVAERPE